MDNMQTKPKLLLFQQEYNQHSAEFVLMQQREHVKCLSQFFDVTVIHEDCDYQQICEKYEPDLALFESGVNLPNSKRLEVTNIRACPEIPKLGFHNADSWCETRAGILSDMDHWGIETFFSICTTAAENTPAIAQNLFVWPNFIDAEIFRDYAESKIVPVLLTGCQNELYPWRYKVYKILAEFYPSLVCPHHGYRSRTLAGQTLWGERYARTINASWFAPTCGTVAKEIVRKHFEIPGCKACLITEQSPGLQSAGFVDMENCVFADEQNVIDKVAYLFQHPDELRKIISAGYQLVHSRHTIEHRDQVFQWFSLNKNLKANQKIVQIDPFQPLTVVEKSSGIGNSHILSNSLHLALLRKGGELLWTGKYEEAERLYLKCLNCMNQLSEPRVGIALCNLYKGNPKMALSWIVPPIRYTLAEYKAIDPDPVEWAYFIICLVCLGNLRHATKRASQFPWLRHPELDRTRWVIKVLTNNGDIAPLFDDYDHKHRCSIHQLPSRSFSEWIEQLCIMLKACGQFAAAETLTTLLSAESLSFQQRLDGSGSDGKMLVKQKAHIYRNLLNRRPLFFRKKVTLRHFDNPLLYSRLRFKLGEAVLNFLRRLEAKCGYFLPYYLSDMRNDEFFAAIRRLAREEDIKTALIVGATVGKGSTEAFLAGALENENIPVVFCVSGSTRRLVKLWKSAANNPVVKWYEVSSSSPGNLPEELEKTIKKIKEDNHINFFDAVLIDSSRLKHQLSVSRKLNKELHGARFVLLDDINSVYNYENHNELLRDPNYVLVAHNPGLRNGYAIFKKDRYVDGGKGTPLLPKRIRFKMTDSEEAIL